MLIHDHTSLNYNQQKLIFSCFQEKNGHSKTETSYHYNHRHPKRCALRPGETDQHCLPDMKEFQKPVLACSFRHHQIFQTFHIRQAHFACWQAKCF